MSNVKRVYVEKKPEFAVTAKGLGHEIRHYLGIKDVTGVRVLIRYDAENISDETFEKACNGIFAEPPVAECLQSLRSISFTEKVLQRMRQIGAFQLNFFRDSLTREQIQQNSVSDLSKKMRHR